MVCLFISIRPYLLTESSLCVVLCCFPAILSKFKPAMISLVNKIIVHIPAVYCGLVLQLDSCTPHLLLIPNQVSMTRTRLLLLHTLSLLRNLQYCTHKRGGLGKKTSSDDAMYWMMSCTNSLVSHTLNQKCWP